MCSKNNTLKIVNNHGQIVREKVAPKQVPTTVICSLILTQIDVSNTNLRKYTFPVSSKIMKTDFIQKNKRCKY